MWSPLLLLACTPAAPPSGPTAPSTPRGVVLVTVDTWRADHLNETVSPHFQALADGGARFTQAWSPIGLTSAAHASLFTGLLPPHHGVRGNNHHGYALAESFTTLAESFSAQGWDTAAFTTGWPAGPEGGLGQGFDVFSGPPSGERATGDALAEAKSWLESREQPWLLWLHAYEPHGPYKPPAVEEGTVGNERAAYAGEVQAVDGLLGPWLHEVRAAGNPVVLTSDHGEVLDEEPCHWQHERSSSEHVLRVPLVLAGPTIPAQVRTDTAGLHDLFPTLHAMAGLADPGGHQGKNLLAGETGRTVWVGESGFCEVDCSPGCDPAGFLGKDRVVYAKETQLVDRPGAGRLGDEALASHLEGYDRPKPPAGPSDPGPVKSLGYVE
jgi:arylsulfatase A-like enzyme